MEPNDDTLMTPFDHLISSQELQMLKLMIPYTPPSNQTVLAAYVKFMEFQRTLSVFQNPEHNMQMQSAQNASSPLDILNEMRPYLPKKNGELIEQIMNMMSMMDMMSSFQSTDQQSGGQGMDPMDLMKGMLSPEQQGMFDTYNMMFSGQDMTAQDMSFDGPEQNDAQKEYDDEKGTENNGHECMDEQPFNEKYGPYQAAADSDSSGTDSRQKWELTGSGSYEPDYRGK